MQTQKLFYQTDFQPGYQQFQQQISIISKSASISKSKINLQKLLHQIQLIKEQIEDQGLQYHQNNIFKRYATVQEMTNKKKNASDCCYHCGEEMKKSIQCQLCAQLFCKNCCWRKRVVPFEEHSDFRLSCQECHQTYIKFFNNREFFKQKAIILKALQELQRKYQKSQTKYHKKQLQINEYKKQKQSVKLKQALLKKSLLDEDKKIQQLKQQYTYLMQQKANKKMMQQKANKKKEQQQKRTREQIMLVNKQKQQKQQQRQKERKKKEQEQLQLKMVQKRQQQIKKIDEMKQRQQNKIIEEIQIKKTVDGVQIKKQQIEKINIIKNEKENEKEKEQIKQIDFDEILNGSFDVKKMQIQQNQHKKQQIKQKETQQNVKNNNKNSQFQEKIQEQQIKKQQKQQQKQIQKSEQLIKPQRPSVTMNQIKSMNINDLLAMKIPMNPAASPNKPVVNKRKQDFLRKSLHEIKAAQNSQNQNSTTTQNNQGLILSVNDQLLGFTPVVALDSNNDLKHYHHLGQEKQQKSVIEEQEISSENNLRKQDILRSSLISSTNQYNKRTITSEQANNDEQDQVVQQPQKCSCEIM